MFHQVQTWRAIRTMCTDSSLKESHVNNHASNYLALDYFRIISRAQMGYESITHEAEGRMGSKPMRARGIIVLVKSN